MVRAHVTCSHRDTRNIIQHSSITVSIYCYQRLSSASYNKFFKFNKSSVELTCERLSNGNAQCCPFDQWKCCSLYRKSKTEAEVIKISCFHCPRRCSDCTGGTESYTVGSKSSCDDCQEAGAGAGRVRNDLLLLAKESNYRLRVECLCLQRCLPSHLILP